MEEQEKLRKAGQVKSQWFGRLEWESHVQGLLSYRASQCQPEPLKDSLFQSKNHFTGLGTQHGNRGLDTLIPGPKSMPPMMFKRKDSFLCPHTHACMRPPVSPLSDKSITTPKFQNIILYSPGYNVSLVSSRLHRQFLSCLLILRNSWPFLLF